MRRGVHALLLISLGGAVLHSTVLTDLYLRYVKDALRMPLIISAVLLVLLGLAGAARGPGFTFRRRTAPSDTEPSYTDPSDTEPSDTEPSDTEPSDTEPSDTETSQAGQRTSSRLTLLEDPHHHAEGPHAAWLLFIPTVMLLVLAPPALGSYTAAKDNRQAMVEPAGAQTLPPAGIIPLTMTEFTGQFVWDEMGPLRGRVVRLSGFVTPASNGRWYLSRLVVSCCAADANALKVQIRGDHPRPADTWVTVTGVWHPTEPDGGDPAPVLDVRTVHQIPTPTNPYRDIPPSRAN